MTRRAGLLVAAALALGTPAVAAEDGFDFYVLALSWSPSYCSTAGSRADPLQCGADKAHAFIVHGLWPQHERGYPTACRTSARPPSGAEVEKLLPVIPSRSLIRHQWQRHGTCSGLSPSAYFEKTAAARARVTMPARYESASAATVSPREVETAFIAANPGLRPGAVAVTCGDGLLKEVRICMGKDLSFRSCPEVDRDTCRRDRVSMPGR